MKRNLVVTVLCLVVFAFSENVASAQTPAAMPVQDHWSDLASCLAATGAPFYHPTIIKTQKLGKDEVVWGNPTGGCVPLVLPDRLGGKGFVRVEPGREFVYHAQTGQALRLKECNNATLGPIVPFPAPPTIKGEQGETGAMGIQGLQGIPGPPGPQGPPGRDGRNIVVEKGGWCSSKKCKFTIGIAAVAITGSALYARWYYSCPPGTIRK